MRSECKQIVTICVVYANKAHANFANLNKSSFNQQKKVKIKKSYFDTLKWTSKESDTTFLW